jgi:hypothetical protein
VVTSLQRYAARALTWVHSLYKGGRPRIAPIPQVAATDFV